MNQRRIEAAIKKAVGKYLNPKECAIFLFGSRAGAEGRPSSDYDIGLFTGRRIPLKVIAKIRDELEDFPIPVDVDFVDFFSVSEEFKILAMKEARFWNEPKRSLKPS